MGLISFSVLVCENRKSERPLPDIISTLPAPPQVMDEKSLLDPGKVKTVSLSVVLMRMPYIEAQPLTLPVSGLGFLAPIC